MKKPDLAIQIGLSRGGSVPLGYAAIGLRASRHCDQISESAFTNRSISPSEWNGEGVRRNRSVPFGTVG